MEAKQINQTFDLVSYISKLVTLHKRGEYFIGACPMCGGRDRFNIWRAQNGDVWFCRKCQADKYHSTIDFIMKYHGENFTNALRRVGGNIKQRMQETANKKPVQTPTLTQVLPSLEWQANAWTLVESAASRLMGDDFHGLFAWRYLAERGLSRGTIFRNWLGCAIVYGRPAIVIPWLDNGNRITAVKYRFIDDLARKDKGKRFSMMAGSLPYLFGIQHILESDEKLLFVEGELNAISISQTLPRSISVVSAGAETNGNPALLRALARHYNEVVIWTDDHNKGKTIRERMNCPEARILQSPVSQGVKCDANQILKAGLLVGFVAHQLSTVCDGVPTSGDSEKV